MKKLLAILIAALVLCGAYKFASAATLPVASGGTGATTLTGCLTGNGTAAITGTGSACGSGGSSSFPWPWTPSTNFAAPTNATSGMVWYQNGMNASSTSEFESLSTFGTTLLAVTGGNVGIGTTSPISQFQVEGSSAGIRLIRTGGNEPFIYLYNGLNGTGGQLRALTGSLGLRFTNDTANTEWARFGPTGNFGIGSTSPSTALSVQGNSQISGNITSVASVTATGTLTLSALTGTQCLHEISGVVSGTGSDCGSGSGSAFPWPWTPSLNYAVNNNATTGITWYQNGLNASSTSHFVSASTTGLTVSRQANVQPVVSGSVAQFVGSDGAPLRITLDTHNDSNTSGTALMYRRSRGTSGTPLADQQDDVLGSVNFRGYGTTGYAAGSTALMTAKAEGVFTDTSMGTALTFDTTATTSVTASERMRISGTGLVGIGTTSPFVGPLTVESGATYTTNAFFTGSINNFMEAMVQNRNTGNAASSDFVAANDKGTASTYYADFGINGSGYSQASQNSENPGDAYLYSSDGGLVLGTASSTFGYSDIRFVVGGLASSSIKAVVANNGNFGIGTTSPYAALSIVGASGVVAGRYTATSTIASIFPYASTTAITSSGTANFSTDGVSRTGIGTTSPGSTLGVQGNALISGGLNVAGINATNTVSIASQGGILSRPYLVVGPCGNGDNTHTVDICAQTSSVQNVVSLIRTSNSFNNFLQFQPSGGNNAANVNWLMGVNGNSDSFSFGLYDGSSVKTKFTVMDIGRVGIGVASPTAHFAVESGSTTEDIVSFGTTTGKRNLWVDKNGNNYYGGDAPTLSSCGTTQRLFSGSNNNAGRFQVGSDALQVTCTLTFADGGWTGSPNGSAPACDVNVEGGLTIFAAASTTQTTMLVTAAATFASDYVSYQCHGF